MPRHTITMGMPLFAGLGRFDDEAMKQYTESASLLASN